MANKDYQNLVSWTQRAQLIVNTGILQQFMSRWQA